MGKPVLSIVEVSKSYQQGKEQLKALRPFSLDIQAGEIVGLVGASGCGKSTLLHIAGLLTTPSSGQVIIAGQSCDTLSEKQATMLRRHNIGFIYQFHHLLPELSVTDNIAMPLMLQGTRDDARVAQMIEAVELTERATHLPSELSGGQQQRVAIARGLIHKPNLLLADEPTGNLDPNTAKQCELLMMNTIRDAQSAALIVTHNHALADKCDRVITLSTY